MCETWYRFFTNLKYFQRWNILREACAQLQAKEADLKECSGLDRRTLADKVSISQKLPKHPELIDYDNSNILTMLKLSFLGRGKHSHR